MNGLKKKWMILMDKMQLAKQRGQKDLLSMIEQSRPLLSIDEVSSKVRKPRSVIKQLIKENVILSIPQTPGGWMIPSWQIKNGRFVPWVGRVIENVLEDEKGNKMDLNSSWKVLLTFFETPMEYLDGKKPKQVLQEGDSEQRRLVLRAALQYMVHGAS